MSSGARLASRHFKRRIPRAEVTNIDHPGKVAAIVGFVMAVSGIVGLYSPASFGCDGEEGPFCGLLTLPLTLAGIGVLGYGSWAWGSSVWSAQSMDAAYQRSMTPRTSHRLGLQVQRRF